VSAIAIMITLLASGSTPGAVQQFQGDDPVETSSSLRANIALLTSDDFAEPVQDTFVPPRSLALEPAAPAADEAAFSMGPEGGYLRARGAERGTWFGGVKARLHVLHFLAAEASITFHQNRYQDNGVVVTQYPVQLTAFFYIIPEGPIRPYILGGVGWYYTRVDYRDSFSLTNSDTTKNFFGEHLGAGAELFLSPRVSLDADVRYIFVNATNEQVIHRDFNYWQIAFGLNFYF
jgi:opacity protein-like surface antigen